MTRVVMIFAPSWGKVDYTPLCGSHPPGPKELVPVTNEGEGLISYLTKRFNKLLNRSQQDTARAYGVFAVPSRIKRAPGDESCLKTVARLRSSGHLLKHTSTHRFYIREAMNTAVNVLFGVPNMTAFVDGQLRRHGCTTPGPGPHGRSSA